MLQEEFIYDKELAVNYYYIVFCYGTFHFRYIAILKREKQLVDYLVVALSIAVVIGTDWEGNENFESLTYVK